MISYLKGQILSKEGLRLVLDVRDVGYELNCSQNTLDDLGEQGDAATLWIYTHVREDQFVLFGFSSDVEKKLFESLIKVNGVGPKMAVTILSGARLDTIIDSIETENVKALTKLPKVGKKTAEQMILTLKGKLVFETPESGASSSQAQELASALSHLGFSPVEVDEVVPIVLKKESEFENQVRTALGLLRGEA